MHVQSSVAGVELVRASGEEQEMNRPGGKLPQRLLRGRRCHPKGDDNEVPPGLTRGA